jgi:hypothetical protein
MKKLLLLLIIPFLSFGQEFHKQYFGTPNSTDYGFYFEETYDGGYIIAGGTTATGGGANSYIIKTNMFGDVVWSQIIDKSGGGEDDWATCIRELETGNFIVAGVLMGAGEYRIPYLMELNSAGDEIWTEFYYSSYMEKNILEGAEVIRFIEPTEEGGYFLVGKDNTTGWNANTGCQQGVIKVDSTGFRIFDSYVCSGPDIDNDGISNSYDFEYNNSWNQPTYGWLTGNSLFNQSGVLSLQCPSFTISGPGYGMFFNSVEATSDGGLIFCGMANFSQISNKGYQAFVVKLNSNGEVEWDKDFGGWNDDAAYGIQETDDGGYIVVGSTESLGIAD